MKTDVANAGCRIASHFEVLFALLVALAPTDPAFSELFAATTLSATINPPCRWTRIRIRLSEPMFSVSTMHKCRALFQRVRNFCLCPLTLRRKQTMRAEESTSPLLHQHGYNRNNAHGQPIVIHSKVETFLTRRPTIDNASRAGGVILGNCSSSSIFNDHDTLLFQTLSHSALYKL